MYQIQSTQKLPLQLHNWRLAFSFMLQTQSKEKGPFILHQKITNLRKNIVQNTRYYIWIGLSCLLPRMVNRASLKRAKLEFKTQSCVFWVLFMYKVERKKIEISEMSGSALPGGVRTPRVRHLSPFLENLFLLIISIYKKDPENTWLCFKFQLS